MHSQHSDWKVVPSSGHKKRMMRNSRNKRTRTTSLPCSTTSSSAINQHVDHEETSTMATSSYSYYCGPVVDDLNLLFQVLSTCMTHCSKCNFLQQFWNKLEKLYFHQDNQNCQAVAIDEIVCYGIGNFSKTSLYQYSAPMWQLACILCLRNKLTTLYQNNQDIPIFFYDPIMMPLEGCFLRERCNVDIVNVNERGGRLVNGTRTLFFMPHCPSGLYETLIWTNWQTIGQDSSSSILIVGNSLHGYSESLGVIERPCLRAILPFVKEEKLDTCANYAVHDMPGNYTGAFNDTYLITFTCCKEIDHSCWPERPYDLSHEHYGARDIEIL